jgi:hypothetical protein
MPILIYGAETWTWQADISTVTAAKIGFLRSSD